MSNQPLTEEEIEDAQLVHVFSFHPPATSGVIIQHEAARRAALDFARKLVVLMPADGVERERALEHARLAMFWANAAIACRQ